MSDGPVEVVAPVSGRAPGRASGLGSRLPLILAILSLLTLVCLLVPGRVSGSLFALLGVAFPAGLIALGASRHGRLDRRVVLVLVLLLGILEASVAGVLVLSGDGAASAWTLFGLPAATLVQVAGLWLLPLPLVALAYAWTFDRAGVTREDLAALRRRRVGEGDRSAARPVP